MTYKLHGTVSALHRTTSVWEVAGPYALTVRAVSRRHALDKGIAILARSAFVTGHPTSVYRVDYEVELCES